MCACVLLLHLLLGNLWFKKIPHCFRCDIWKCNVQECAKWTHVRSVVIRLRVGPGKRNHPLSRSLHSALRILRTSKTRSSLCKSCMCQIFKQGVIPINRQMCVLLYISSVSPVVSTEISNLLGLPAVTRFYHTCVIRNVCKYTDRARKTRYIAFSLHRNSR